MNSTVELVNTSIGKKLIFKFFYLNKQLFEYIVYQPDFISNGTFDASIDTWRKFIAGKIEIIGFGGFLMTKDSDIQFISYTVDGGRAEFTIPFEIVRDKLSDAITQLEIQLKSE